MPYNSIRRPERARQNQTLRHAAVAHLVERHLAKVEVASSSLVGRSISEIWFQAAGLHLVQALQDILRGVLSTDEGKRLAESLRKAMQ